MRIGHRRTFIFGRIGLAAAFIVCAAAQSGFAQRAAAPDIVPASTVVMLRIPDVQVLKERFADTALGRIGQEPQVQPILQHLMGSTGQLWDEIRGESSVQVEQLLAIPQGEICFAVVVLEEGAPTPVVLIDVGDQLPVAKRVLEHITGLAVDDGAERSETTVSGTKIETFSSSRPFSVFIKDNTVVLGARAEALAELLKRWDGSGDGESLRGNERFRALMNSVRASRDDAAQFVWYVDPVGILQGIARENTGAQFGLAALPALGLDGLQGFGGSIAFAAEEFDQITHIHVLLDSPRTGVIDLVQLGEGDMTPEAWVPSDVASYTTMYWDAKRTFQKLRGLVDSFQAEGTFDSQVQRRLSGPLGVEFESEILPYIDGRISHLKLVQKPVVSLESNATLVAVKLKDAKAFEGVLERIMGRFEGRVEQRPIASSVGWVVGQPAQPDGVVGSAHRQACFAIYDGYFMVADRPAMLERVLAGNSDPSKSLASSLEYKLIASKAQRQAGSSKPGLMTFSRPEEDLRMMYDLAVSPGSRDRLRGAAENNRMLGALHSALEASALPPFEVLSKYLAPGGGVVFNEDTGFHYTGFGLRRK